MSLLESDPDSDSSTESNLHLETPTAEKVPLAASVHLQRVTPKEPLPEKLTVRFSPIGSAPAINPPSFKVAGTQTVGTIQKYLMKRLRMKTIHLYVSNSFEPTPDEKLGSLHGLFHTNGELHMSYCEGVAFG